MTEPTHPQPSVGNDPQNGWAEELIPLIQREYGHSDLRPIIAFLDRHFIPKSSVEAALGKHKDCGWHDYTEYNNHCCKLELADDLRTLLTRDDV